MNREAEGGAVRPIVTFNVWAQRIYDFNATKGWHEGAPVVADFLMNLHGEVSELWEAYRRRALDEPCDKAAKMEEPLTCIEEELADVLIRTLDMAAAFGVDIDRAVGIKMAFNATRPWRHGGKVA